ncbi:MAG: SH3 domain-containing protein, partial [Thiobacillus sp.]|nr:SH3 domain-containing protein [Thiobacillus sp.]
AGLRGLNDEDLKRAQFNADELARMEALGVAAAQARSFARQSGLVAVKVAELPKPQSEQSSSPWGNN